MKGLKVLIVEDDAFSRSALVDALRHQGFNVVGATDNAREAISICQTFEPHVCICDLDLGVGPTGVDVVHALRRVNEKLGIIILTSYRDPRLADPNIAPLPLGAIMMNKQELTNMAVLGMQINAAAREPHKKRREGKSEIGKFQSLSNLQIEILKNVADGMSTAEIARDRGVSEQSIEKTIQRICRNLEIPVVNDRNQRIQLVRAFYYGAGHEL